MGPPGFEREPLIEESGPGPCFELLPGFSAHLSRPGPLRGQALRAGFKSHPRRCRFVAVESPTDLTFNRGLIADPEAFARDANAASWLCLCGEQFAEVDGGMSYDDVRAAVPESANVVSDPPTVLDTDLARKQVAALEQLPRPTLVTCRTGPRSSALVYLYSGLKAGATADEVLARAEADGAPFTRSDELKDWVAQNLDQLS
jgi:hypothetical protein